MWNQLWNWLEKKSVPILISSGIFAWLSAVITAVKATPKALEDIEIYKEITGHDELTTAQIIEVAGKNYIWTAVSAGIGTGCLIAAGCSSNYKIASLMTACNISQNGIREFAEYRQALQDQLGVKKEQEIYAKVLEQQVQNNPPTQENTAPQPAPTPPTTQTQTEVVATIPLCYDATFGRYLNVSYDKVAEAVNKLGERILTGIDGFASLNDFYYEINATPIEFGEHIGWNLDTGIPRIQPKEAIRYTGTPTGVPCWILKFVNPPQYEYNFFRG